MSVDEQYLLDADRSIYLRDANTEPVPAAPEVDADAEIVYLSSAYVSAELVVDVLFENAGVPKLGGASGDRGWSSVSTFQNCPYRWKRVYVDGCREAAVPGAPGPKSLEVGSLVHVLLAIYYSKIIDSTYPLEPESFREALLKGHVTPEHVTEAWRLYEAYTLYYAHDDFVPLAVEYHLVDPRTSRSCRYDVIMRKEKPSSGLLPGTYLFDHKTMSRMDSYALSQWRNNGELIGQWELYEKLKLERRFGELVGMCANIIVKTKDPKFERAWIRPSDALLRDHRKSLAVWSAQMDLAKATNQFPRARANCVGKYGLCD
ncbi:MAG TPA: PD-(D/E)XK nuclease family protein, partial [Acidimicrobiales bacterium]